MNQIGQAKCLGGASASEAEVRHSRTLIKGLTYVMFLVFAMTTDAVGVIIPELIREFSLSHTAAGAFHYVPMAAIGLSGILLGFLADKFGRKLTVILGLILYAWACFLFIAGSTFGFFVALLAVSGVAIGVFKTGALALIGDISSSGREHTSTMNLVEGFFGVGAIVGPALVAYLLATGVSWKYLYVVAGGICMGLVVLATCVKYPVTQGGRRSQVDLRRTLAMTRNRYALGFSLAAALYVGTEAAIYVWMPTYLLGYDGSAVWLASYSLTVFFVLRAGGRFLGGWVLKHCRWTAVMLWFSAAIFLCYLGSMILGVDAAVYLLPLSGLFMSMMYPTINSKGISCFPKAQHGTVAGVILFFTALAAAAGPLLMGVFSDLMGGDARYGFYLATVFAGLLCLGMLYNHLRNPTRQLLEALEASEYSGRLSE